MKFDPNSTIEDVLVELAVKAEMGKALKDYCICNAGGVTFPNDKTLLDCGLNATDLIVFKTRSAEELKLREVIKAIDEAKDRERKALYFREQMLGELPPYIKILHSCTGLTKLDVSRNKLREIPIEIGYLKSLVEINLNENELITLPPHIGHLTNLQRFYVAENKLAILPPEIGLCTSLVELNLRNNELRRLPRALGFLWMEYLREFQPFGNHLHESIPPDVLSAGGKAIGRFLRQLPDSEAETPKLPDLEPVGDPSELKADEGFAPKPIVSAAKKTALAAAAEQNAPVADSLLFSDDDSNVMSMLDGAAKTAYSDIAARIDKLPGQPDRPSLRVQWSTATSFMLYGRGDPPEKISKLCLLLVTKDDQVLSGNIARLYDTAAATSGRAAAPAPAPAATAAAPAQASLSDIAAQLDSLTK
eukprot:TRINITY_DN2896_c0_g1_i1.p1 TRINITY_DN2896_c0_g1~~TRINITY_DN2896_c0_g1_i1.p1  ORF type:complete len:456 (-),score=104.88 TRINITY_DN2896_c0_g1_i1:48-1304(-)